MNQTVQLIEEMTERALGRADTPHLLSARTERAAAIEHLDALIRNASVAEMPTPPGNNRLLKRLVLRLGGVAVIRQQASNRAVIGALHTLISELDSVLLHLEDERDRSIAAIAGLEQRLLERAQNQPEQENAGADRTAE